MSIDPIIVANGIIRYAKEQGSSVTPMKLQKLAYLVHGLLLAERGDEAGVKGGFEAWPYGPVNRDIYLAFRKYGGQAISEPLEELYDTKVPTLGNVSGGKETQEAIVEVWKAFGEWSAVSLSDFTHREGSPWSKAVAGFKSRGNTDRGPEPFDRCPIEDGEIKRYFVNELLEPPKETAA